jgi:hypothetical protein
MLPLCYYPQPTAHSPQPTAHSPLPTAHCPLPTAHCPLPTAHCPLPTDGVVLCTLQVAKLVHEKAFRPKLPRSWAAELTSLLERMWAQQPAERPTFAQIASEIDGLLAAGAKHERGVGGMLGVRDHANTCSSGCVIS